MTFSDPIAAVKRGRIPNLHIDPSDEIARLASADHVAERNTIKQQLKKGFEGDNIKKAIDQWCSDAKPEQLNEVLMFSNVGVLDPFVTRLLPSVVPYGAHQTTLNRFFSSVAIPNMASLPRLDMLYGFNIDHDLFDAVTAGGVCWERCVGEANVKKMQQLTRLTAYIAFAYQSFVVMAPRSFDTLHKRASTSVKDACREVTESVNNRLSCIKTSFENLEKVKDDAYQTLKDAREEAKKRLGLTQINDDIKAGEWVTNNADFKTLFEGKMPKKMEPKKMKQSIVDEIKKCIKEYKDGKCNEWNEDEKKRCEQLYKGKCAPKAADKPPQSWASIINRNKPTQRKEERFADDSAYLLSAVWAHRCMTETGKLRREAVSVYEKNTLFTDGSFTVNGMHSNGMSGFKSMVVNSDGSVWLSNENGGRLSTETELRPSNVIWADKTRVMKLSDRYLTMDGWKKINVDDVQQFVVNERHFIYTKGNGMIVLVHDGVEQTLMWRDSVITPYSTKGERTSAPKMHLTGPSTLLLVDGMRTFEATVGTDSISVGDEREVKWSKDAQKMYMCQYVAASLLGYAAAGELFMNKHAFYPVCDIGCVWSPANDDATYDEPITPSFDDAAQSIDEYVQNIATAWHDAGVIPKTDTGALTPQGGASMLVHFKQHDAEKVTPRQLIDMFGLDQQLRTEFGEEGELMSKRLAKLCIGHGADSAVMHSEALQHLASSFRVSPFLKPWNNYGSASMGGGVRSCSDSLIKSMHEAMRKDNEKFDEIKLKNIEGGVTNNADRITTWVMEKGVREAVCFGSTYVFYSLSETNIHVYKQLSKINMENLSASIQRICDLGKLLGDTPSFANVSQRRFYDNNYTAYTE